MTPPPAAKWIVLGAVVLAAGYLPTLHTPFDFTDDGNLVYPAPAGTTAAGHFDRWWDKVRANYDHLGPFRPTLWVHWELAANTLGADPLAWRACRLAWCGLAAGMLLWLMRELGASPPAALLAGAVAMWNPYRNEIWTSLTLAEGWAMPYALFALVAARKAAGSARPLGWDVAGLLAVVVALGCKNTFAAVVPAQLLVRAWSPGGTLRDGLRANAGRVALLGSSLILPAVHFAYFKLHWHPGQYETPGVTAAQLGRVLSSLKGAVSLDFMAAGLALCLLALWMNRRMTTTASPPANEAAPPVATATPSAVWAAVLLTAAGAAAYAPMGMMSGRYSMPGVWGLDVLFALLLTRVLALPATALRTAAVGGVCAGLAAVMVASIGKQEKFAARARLLWDAVYHVEATAPVGARVAWVSGDSLRGGLNVEEGIHFRWHLQHRGRADIAVGLYDAAGGVLPRTELPPPDGPPDIRVAGEAAADAPGWQPERSFAAPFWAGRRMYACTVSRKPSGLAAGLSAAARDDLRRLLFADVPAGGR